MEADELKNRIVTTQCRNRLTWYEEQIMKATNKVVSILRELRDDPMKPWLATHETLDAYLQDRWGISVRRQRQLFAAEDTRLLLADEAPDLAPEITAMPERQMRVLVETPPARRVEVLRKAIVLGSADGKRTVVRGVATAATMKRAKAIVIDGAPGETEAKKCPACGRAMP